ncbi:MAG: flagellar hook-associated protein FlgK [Lachnospiraceae bacterium]|nr:flagellar hook-associated protein FlgK [Lachnospiraceae bacterium]
MPSTFFGLNIATSGMSAYYAGLNTTAHNISNKNTKGYSKQEVQQQAKVPISLKTSYGMMGAGVDVKDITSSRDVYYDYKYRKSNAVYGRYDTLDHYMENLQSYLYSKDSESGGITNALNDFFKTVSQQTTDASDTTMRRQVSGAADTLMNFIRETANNLQQAQKEVNTQIKSTVSQINSYALQIASLNKQINTLEVNGGTANDLRDQRAKLIDELSQLVDVEVVTDTPPDGQGLEEFLVFIGDGALVDTYTCNQIQIEASTTKDNQTDCEGLYKLKWTNGQEFNIRSGILGGQLQALFELRDGNNSENFAATFTGYDAGSAAAPGKITLKASQTDSSCSANSWDLSKLNIPESDGMLKIYNYEFQYDSFEVSVCADGSYEYTFTLKEPLNDGQKQHLDVAMTKGKTQSTVGDDVDFRGIPYYMSQLNEFVRTFSANVNQVQNTGYDLYQQKGCDLFVATTLASGEQFDMAELLYNKKEGCYYLNGEAQRGLNGSDVVYAFSSKAVKGKKTSYYSMTALNVNVSDDILEDGKKLAFSADPNAGVAAYDNLTKLSALREDNSMFKQGIPSNFLAVMTATIGVDGAKIDDCTTNSKNILDAVDNRRLSKSGVDEDEEGQHMIEYQNLLNYQYRVISVMNEVLDKLINGTGV